MCKSCHACRRRYDHECLMYEKVFSAVQFLPVVPSIREGDKDELDAICERDKDVGRALGKRCADFEEFDEGEEAS